MKLTASNKAQALQILEAAVQVASTDAELPSEWITFCTKLSAAVTRGQGSGTFIAALGTALLARALDQGIDPFALQEGTGTPGAYSARSLCKDVLAAHAPRLGFHLGVTGREPLNNQPFFAKKRISRELPVKANARPGFEILLEALGEVEGLTEPAAARLALAAFVRVRSSPIEQLELDARLISGADATEFANRVREFVSQASEKGKRAQAAVAGILDAVATPERVLVARVHDPDRRFPGDVAVTAPGELRKPVLAVEVRDKPVTESDLFHFAQKAADRDVSFAVVVALAQRAVTICPAEATTFAASRGVSLVLYVGWDEFVSDATLWACVAGDCSGDFHKRCSERIWARLADFEVSLKGQRLWLELMTSNVGGEQGTSATALGGHGTSGELFSVNSGLPGPREE